MSRAASLRAELTSLANAFEEERISSAERLDADLVRQAVEQAKPENLEQWKQVVHDATAKLQQFWEDSEQALIRETYALATSYLRESDDEVHRLQMTKKALEEQLETERRRSTRIEEQLAALQSRLLDSAAPAATTPADDARTQQEVLRSELQGFMEELVRNQRESLRVLQEELQRVREEASVREENLLRQIAHLKTELAVARTDNEVSSRQLRQLETSAGREEVQDELGPGTIWPPHLTPRRGHRRFQRHNRLEDAPAPPEF